ncbi:MAG TPA: DNA replication/repair protein RecF [Actinomycetes bacterium]|jgi:DNA replication and repair protein RecF|nr:DNA replication/repair protein RecF [Actinomycetes bacterium]
MYLERLELIDFRNHAAVTVDLSPGPSVLLGPNGAGKTNILEAIGYLATLGSHRPGQESSLVRVGTEAGIIRAVAVRAGRTILVDLEIRPGTGLRGRVNRVPVPRARDLLGMVRATLFAPEDLAIVRGDPEERRRFLDALAVQRLPRYLAIRQDYERILRQRNSLLRSAGGRLPSGAGLATLDVWDEKLANAGGELWAERVHLVEAVRPLVERAYQELASNPDSVEMVYVSSVLGTEGPAPGQAALAQAIRERLLADRPREVERGITLSGPHRDDLALALRGLPARTHASHGEAWSLALAFRLAAHQLLANEGEEPILLLDDVFAELDRRRRERLVDLAMAVEQSVITAPMADELPEQLKATMFHVEPGNVTREAGP